MACRLVWLLNKDGPDARLRSDEAEQAVDAVDGPVSADVKAVAAGATPVHGWAFGTVKGAAWHRPPSLWTRRPTGGTTPTCPALFPADSG